MEIPPFIFVYVAYRIFAEVVLFRFLKKGKLAIRGSLLEAPGISILLPIRGPVEGLDVTLRSLLFQEYLGPLEIIIAIKDPKDPALVDSKHIVESIGSALPVKWVVGPQGEGFNPKNSNLKRAYENANQPWIYVADADTRPPLRHLSEMMVLAKNEPTNYVTAHSVYFGAEDFGAKLESLGTNFEAVTYFLASELSPNSAYMNGASMLFSRELLERAGGINTIVNSLTDDAFLGGLFQKTGGKAHLARDFVKVELRNEKFSAFVQRYLRWMLIARCYIPKLFWLAPLSWFGIWFILYGLLTSHLNFIFWGAGVFLSRVVESYIIQIKIGCANDRFKCWIMVFYDLIIPFLWLASVFKTSVKWGNQTLIVNRDGQLKGAQ